MEENNDKFTIIDEFDNEREAEVVTTFELDGKNYVVYSLDVDSDNCDVLVSELVMNDDGTATVKDIDSEEEKNKLHGIVNELLNNQEGV